MKRHHKLGLAVLAVVCLAAAFLPLHTNAGGEPIAIAVELSNFNSSNTGGAVANTLLQTSGSAGANGGVLRLTPNLNTQAGTVVRRNQIKLTDGFSTYFQFNVHDSSSTPADGLAFIVYKSDTVKTGATGEGIGYQGISDSIAVEFDTYSNADSQLDPVSPHVGIMLNGSPNHSGQPYYIYSTLTSEQVIHVWVEYNGSTGEVTATYGTNSTKSSNTTITRNVGTALVGQNVYMGFSASTGGSYSCHDVHKWYFKDSYVSGGLSSAANAYTQAASTVGITLDNASNPTQATIKVYDAAGNAMNSDIDIYVDNVMKTTQSVSTSGYTYSMSSLSTGPHTFRAVATGGASNFVNFSVSANPPSISSNPNYQTVNVGQAATFVVGASSPDGGTLSYQWQVYNGSWGNISSTNSASYTTGTLAITDNEKRYRCVVTNTKDGKVASATSGETILTVNRLTGTVSITGDPSKTYDGIAVNDPTLSKNGSGGVSYTYFSDNSGSRGTQISGSPMNAGTYWVRASVAQCDTYTQAMAERQFSISKKTIADAEEAKVLLSYSLDPKTYNGTSLSVQVTDEPGVTGLGAITVYYQGTGDTVYAKSTTAPTVAGTYRMIVDIAQGSNYGNYTAAELGIYTISRATITGVSASGYSDTYDGNAHSIMLSGVPSGAVVTYRTTDNGEYNLSSQPVFTNAGTYTVYYKISKTNYNDVTGSQQVVIEKKDLKASMVSDITGTFTYNGTAQTPVPAVSDGEPSIIQASDFAVSYTQNVNPGTATVTVLATVDGNYNGSLNKTFEISKKALQDAMIADIGSLTFSGAELEPVPVVTDGEPSIIRASDYTVSYADNIYPGSAVLTVTATTDGYYTGSASKRFVIDKKALASTMIGDITSVIYNGEAQTPTFTVTDGSPNKITTTDYTLSYTDNMNAGTATAIITATANGNYTGAASKTFTIEKKDLAPSMLGAIASVTYNGVAQTPTFTVTDSAPNKITTADYTVSYTNNVSAGTATATITATANGNYTGAASKTFIIEKKELAPSMFGAIASVTYNGVAQTPTFSVTDSAPNKITTTDYTVSYTNNVNAGTATATITAKTNGNYSGVASKTFTIKKKELAPSMIGAIASLTYNGAAQTPSFTVTDGAPSIIKAADYTVNYTNNVNAGTAAATITAAANGNYTGSASKTFIINKKELSGLMVSSISSQSYTGKALKPSVNVEDGTPSIIQSTDYTVSYSSNIGAGTATATVTASDEGNYLGKVSRTFVINPAEITGTLKLPASVISGDIIKADASGILPEEARSSLSYQWQRNGIPISGATKDTYTTTEADAGQKLTLMVVANGNYTGGATSSAITVTASIKTTGSLPITLSSPIFEDDGSVTIGGAITLLEGEYTASISYKPEFGTTWKVLESGTYSAEKAFDVDLTGLNADTVYIYRITVMVDGQTYTMTGRFQTPNAQNNDFTGSIAGSVKDDTGIGKSITVTIEKGNTVIASKTNLKNGDTFTFTKLPDGIYNVVANNGSYKITQIITIHDGKAVSGVNMSIGKKQSRLEIVTDNTPDIAVGGLNELFNYDSMFTTADAKVVRAGGTVEIKLIAEKQEDTNIEGKDQIEQLANGNVAIYLDLSMIKTVLDKDGNTGEQTELSELADLIEVVIPIPEDIKGKNHLTVYRMHDGVAEVIPNGIENANSDGEYCVVSDDYVTLYVKKFSTYAIGYEQRAEVNSFYFPWWLIVLLIVISVVFTVIWRNTKKARDSKREQML